MRFWHSVKIGQHISWPRGAEHPSPRTSTLWLRLPAMPFSIKTLPRCLSLTLLMFQSPGCRCRRIAREHRLQASQAGLLGVQLIAGTPCASPGSCVSALIDLKQRDAEADRVDLFDERGHHRFATMHGHTCCTRVAQNVKQEEMFPGRVWRRNLPGIWPLPGREHRARRPVGILAKSVRGRLACRWTWLTRWLSPKFAPHVR